MQAQRRVMDVDFHKPLAAAGRPTTCAFAREELPNRGHYRFEVRPIECFGRKGDSIASSIALY